jgi:hypothetical protein
MCQTKQNIDYELQNLEKLTNEKDFIDYQPDFILTTEGIQELIKYTKYQTEALNIQDLVKKSLLTYEEQKFLEQRIIGIINQLHRHLSHAATTMTHPLLILLTFVVKEKTEFIVQRGIHKVGNMNFLSI